MGAAGLLARGTIWRGPPSSSPRGIGSFRPWRATRSALEPPPLGLPSDHVIHTDARDAPRSDSMRKEVAAVRWSAKGGGRSQRQL